MQSYNNCSKCPPLTSKHFKILRLTPFSMALLISSPVIERKAFLTLTWQSSFVVSAVANTLSLIDPHIKKSNGVRSGERGGQRYGPSLAIHWSPNVFSKNSFTNRVLCGGAPSCWYHSCDISFKGKFWTCSSIRFRKISRYLSPTKLLITKITK